MSLPVIGRRQQQRSKTRAAGMGTMLARTASAGQVRVGRPFLCCERFSHRHIQGVRLDFSGAPEIAAPAEVVWQRLLDHEFVASVAPGVESVQAIDDRHFKVVSGFGVGAVKVRFQLDVVLSDVNPPRSLKMSARGQAPGSGVDVSTTLEIEPLPADRSRLKWSASSEVRGTVASVGARLLKGTAQKLTESFWDKFAERVSEGSA